MRHEINFEFGRWTVNGKPIQKTKLSPDEMVFANRFFKWAKKNKVTNP